MQRSLVFVGLLAACGGPPGDSPTDGNPPPTDGPVTDGGGVTPGQAVFSTQLLHQIAIEVEPAFLDQLENDTTTRVPCTLTFDGTRLDQVGIRKKGGLGSVTSLAGKTGFSIKLNDFVMGQRLDGLEKLLLNNAQEDPTFVSEHVGYETHRRAGSLSPFTAHAAVTFNGDDYGLFVIKEPIAEDFLERAFGAPNDGGNLYEGFYHPEDQSLGDFATHPEELDLKDEAGRSRADMIAFAAAVRDTPGAGYEAALRAHLDLDHYLTSLAVDTMLGYWDSYAYFLNNYYFYRDPTIDRFRYIPHGMDQLTYSTLTSPMGLLVQRFADAPALQAAFDARLAEVRAGFDVAAITARIDQVETILAGAPLGGRTEQDVQSFRAHVDDVRAAVAGLAP